jgi:Tfp pilus assembly protein PilF
MVDSQIDAEQYDAADQTLARVAAVNPHHPQAHAYRAVLAHLRNQPERETQHRTAALKHWPANPDVDHTIGRKLSQKYRFAEGEQYQRRPRA